MTNKQINEKVENLSTNLNCVDIKISKNVNKTKQLVSKTNKMNNEINEFKDTYNTNLAKQVSEIENLKRLYKICISGLIFIGLILIACI